MSRPRTKKPAAAPAQGFLRQMDAARFCGLSVDTVKRASDLFERTGGQCGLKGRRAGRLVLYAVADLVSWVEAGAPTGVHAAAM